MTTPRKVNNFYTNGKLFTITESLIPQLIGFYFLVLK